VKILRACGFELALDPSHGGEVLWLNWEGEPLLRAAPAGAHDIRDGAAFPLVPFSGRIEQGRFTHDGVVHRLPPNMPPEPHAIHGHGWQSAWHVVDTDARFVTLGMRHAKGAWPWAYKAEQTFSLSPDALNVELSVTNLSAAPMPAGLGWHPYFPRGDAELACDVTGFWPGASGDVPGGLEPVSGMTDLTVARPVDSIVVDNAFRGSGAPAKLVWPSRRLAIEFGASDNLTHWIVYAPQGAGFFCVEPVSHAPNAINMSAPPPGAEMKMLGAGERMTAQCWLRPSRI
jgi:aldose 1-epimerase